MALPPGLTLNRDTGQITGVPTAPGTYTYTLRVRDAQGAVRDVPVTQVINPYDPPIIGGSPVKWATRGVPYSVALSVTDGLAPFVWSVASGSLPTGLTLNAATGLLSGTPSQTSSYTDRPITVRVTDTFGSSDQLPFTLQYRNAFSTTHTYPVGTRGEAYSSTPPVVGGHSPFTWALTSGALPSGLSFTASTGRISGTPSSVGEGPINVRCTDAAGNVINISQTFTVVLDYVPVQLTGSMTGTSKTYQRATGTEVISPSSTLAATGGNATITYSWVRTSGSTKISPAASTSRNTGFNSTAAPGENVSAVFTLTATDGTSSATYTVTISANNDYVFPALSGSMPARSQRTRAYSGGFTRTGGVAPYTWTIAGGALPAGMSLNATSGAITGTPTATSGYGSRTVTVRVTDGQGQVANRDFSLQYQDLPSISGVPAAAYNGEEYTFAPTLSGGYTPRTVALTSGTLQTGLSLNTSTGVISGVPTQTATRAITLTVTDDFGATATLSVSLAVNAYTSPALSGSPPTRSMRTISYSGSFTRSGGLAPYTYTITSGSLPTGLSINASTGVISGTPTATSGYGARSITVRVTDSLSYSTTRSYSLDYQTIPAIGGTPGVAYTGEAFSFTPSLSGGYAPYTVTLQSGTLHPGLSLTASTGQISGTPTASGSRSITLLLTDSFGATATHTINLAVTAYGAPTLTGSPPVRAMRTKAYSGGFGVSGGVAPFSWEITSGTLHAGMSINATTGVISGTPTATSGYGTRNITVRVTDSLGNQGSATYALQYQTVPAISGSPGAAYTGEAFSFTPSRSGGYTPYSVALTSGTLQTGLSLNTTTGAITGTPTQAASRSLNLRITDDFGATANLSVSLVVTAYSKPALSGSYTGTATRTKAYSSNITRSGGLSPYTFALASGSLPAGLAINATTGAITGTPTATSYVDSTFTVRVTDALGNTATTGTQTLVYRNAPTLSGGGALTRRVRGEALVGSVSVNSGTHTPVTYAIVSGGFPTGATFNTSTGVLGGTMTGTTYKTYDATIRVTDAVGNTADRACTLAYANIVSINVNSIPAEGATSIAYSGSTSSAGGHGTRTYTISSGSLPAGLSLNASTGAITGTPTAAYNTSFTVRATDADGRTAQTARSVRIYGPLTRTNWGGGVLVLGSTLNVSGITGGGAKSYTYARASGTLPSGISLNASTGQLTGTVTGTGNYSFTLRVTDNFGRTSTSPAITGNVFAASASPVAPLAEVTLPEPAPASQSLSTSTTVTAVGGSGTYTYTWSRTSGDSSITMTPGGSPSGRTCAFAGLVLKNQSKTATYRCRVSDGTRTYDVSVTVRLMYTTNL